MMASFEEVFMRKTARFFAVILFVIFCLGISSMAEEITLTSYYPAPYGAYTELTATKLDVGVTGVVIGETYSGTETAPASGMLVEGNVGIGKTSTSAELDVNGTVNATSFSVGGVAGYNGDLRDSTGTKIATVVNGIITAVAY